MLTGLLITQALNGLQLGVLLFLLAAGLTLVFGIMNFVNLAHGSLYMMGAYFAAVAVARTGSFLLGALIAHRRAHDRIPEMLPALFALAVAVAYQATAFTS